MACAIDTAYTNPEHTACTSNAAPPLAPSACCTMHAVEGNTMSGVEVATTIKSTSAAATPALCKARCAACMAKVLAWVLASAK
jgi:hypothetical protein